jgi:hypothetical protein
MVFYSVPRLEGQSCLLELYAYMLERSNYLSLLEELSRNSIK